MLRMGVLGLPQLADLMEQPGVKDRQYAEQGLTDELRAHLAKRVLRFLDAPENESELEHGPVRGVLRKDIHEPCALVLVAVIENHGAIRQISDLEPDHYVSATGHMSFL
jgi:hypothetical protein